MRSRGPTAIGRAPDCVPRRHITRMWQLGELVVNAETASVSKMVGPWGGGFVFWQVHAAVVPWIAVSIEAPGRLNRDQRGLGHVARAVLEKGSAW